MNILDYIPVGKGNAVTRKRLVAMTGLDDRAVRKHIENQRAKGAFILNFQDGKGYFQSTDTEDLLHQFRLNRSRAMTVLAQQSPIYSVLKERGIKEEWNKK